MSSRNREKQSSVVSCQLSVVSRNRRRTTDHGPRTKSARRGVLLLVVLSLLVLFMLIGTAYLMSSSQYAKGAKDSGKLNRVGSPPTKLLDSALMQILRDTGESDSAVRYHSLLRDLYGSDGIEAQIYSPATLNLGVPVGQVSRFAGAIAGTPQQNLGPTQGQLIDIYVRQLAFNPIAARSADDPLTPSPPYNENTQLNAPDARHVLQLDHDPNGQAKLRQLPQTQGYYNGCLMTITSGPAAGQSTRVVDYEFLGNIAPNLTNPAPTIPSRLFRFRVMAFPRADGTPLNVDQSAAREPELTDLAGTKFIINGRPFNGTGVGYNPMAAAGTPRLNAVERNAIDTSNPFFSEVALTPNSVHVLISDPVPTATEPDDLYGVFYQDTTGSAPVPRPLNPKAVAPAQRATQWKYPSFVGTGDTDESYDAADYQNMALALQTVLPRPRGRVVQGTDPLNPTYHEADFQNDVVNQPAFNNAADFLRLDLEDLPLPSFHRPDLINYWFHRLAQFAAGGPTFDDEDVLAVLQPYGRDGIRAVTGGDDPAVPVAIRDQIVAIKRKISLRPLREDHPNFDGSNPQSRPSTFASGQVFQVNGTHIAVPFWEAVGPWDVDNDNDGVPDSVWVDLGDPVVQAEDGTLYKPLYAFLILDMDSRLNVNAHGLVDHMDSPQFDTAGNALAGMEDSDFLPQGIGYGPAEISLRPILSPRLPGSALSVNIGRNGVGNLQDADDYARLLFGRPPGNSSPAIWGRHGLDPTPDFTLAVPYKVAPGITSTVAQNATTLEISPAGIKTQFKFFGYPTHATNFLPALLVPSAFGWAPDLMGRYSLGLDHTGQPVNELFRETANDRPLVADSPYELDLSADQRRDVRSDALTMKLDYTLGRTEYFLPGTTTTTRFTAGIANETDDAPFATADLERLVRAFDSDSGILPDRLWNLVDAFDPLKLFNTGDTMNPPGNQPAAVEAYARQLFNDSSLSAGDTNDRPQMLAAAQQMASINRRLVTTDSYDLPVPAQNMPGWASAMGPDGIPGLKERDELAGGLPDPTKLGIADSDDFEAVTGQQFSRATIVNLLHYRVFLDQRRKYIREQGWTEPLSAADQTTLNGEIMNIRATADLVMAGNPATGFPPLAEQLLAPEVIAGQRMDLNRPFGDGRDNGDGIDNDGLNGIDDPGELNYPVGDPNRDPYMNGIVDDPLEAGEPFLDANGNGRWDTGEPYIDMLRDTFGGRTDQYDGPRDQLWQGLTNEPIVFDHTNGHGDPLNADAATGGIPVTATVRNLNSQARQLYARQLYCMMLLLVDEGYLEIPDAPSLGGDNINLEWFLEGIVRSRGNLTATPDDVKLAMQKLTARRIAQWAINCVDFRDADSIMTPFEYDENPWDGWGTSDRMGVLIPLDGDVASNENGDESMLEADMPNNNMAQVIDWNAVASSRVRELSTSLVTGPVSLTEQTRGVVWGVERPELLITETLALHDRRCTDEAAPGEHRSILDTSTTKPGETPDYDLDQRLKPRGSLFVELYNPWTPDGKRPAELYGSVPGSGVPDQGVMLNRLSEIPARDLTGVQKFSPVWRMAVLRDPINGRMTNQVIDLRTPTAPASAKERNALSAQFLQTDPDGYGMDMDIHAERHVYFTTGDNYRTLSPAFEGDTERRDDDNLRDTASMLGEWERLGAPVGTPPPIPLMKQIKVWVPPVQPREVFIGGVKEFIPATKRHFIARTERVSTSVLSNDRDVMISPILPGRYAVIGSSGMQLKGFGAALGSVQPTLNNQVTDRYVTPIGRVVPKSSNPGVADSAHLTDMHITRRVELWPSLIGNPNLQQVLVAQNGGPEFMRTGASVVNVTDPDLDGRPGNAAGVPAVIAPAVAIPVEDLNVSEPVEGYPSVRYQELYIERNGGITVPDPKLDSSALTNYGELAYDAAYDRPFDLEPELVFNGTTQNYRSIHLQRLANPQLPWNPPAFDAAGNRNLAFRPEFPVNPYRTIDSQSVDLTAFNGATELERDGSLPTSAARTNMSIEPRDLFQSVFMAPLTAGQYLQAPDHVLWALIYELYREGILASQMSVEDFRAVNENTVEGTYLKELERRKRNTVTDKDLTDRDLLVNPNTVSDPTNGNYDWSKEWGWHMYPRVLPDDTPSGNVKTTGTYRQWFHLKSLERGAHNTTYFKYPNPAEFYHKYIAAYTSNPASVPEGWTFDLGWEPRLLWKQERPNVRLFLRGVTGLIDASDLENSMSARILQGISTLYSEDERKRAIADDDVARYQAIWPILALGSTDTDRRDVIPFVLEQTLGFANEAYAPELDRNDGTDSVAILNSVKPGAPEVALDRPPAPPSVSAPANPIPGMPAEKLGTLAGNYSVPKEVLNTPRRSAKRSAIGDPNEPIMSLFHSLEDAIPTLPEAVDDRDYLRAEFYRNRQRLMAATFPWLAWNDRPFVSEGELSQVPISPSSLFLRDYSTINRFTPSPYDGDGINPATCHGYELTAHRLLQQNAPFGHLLNFFMTSATPAQFLIVSDCANEDGNPNTTQTFKVTGAPHYYRLLEYVTVPSRYVGTDTLLSPDVFNDDPFDATDNLTGPTDPRYKLQPPFNKVSRQRDPGRVNLNTVVGRRSTDASGANPRSWSEVYDGIMHRYHDNNLFDATSTLMQLSHFGPAWRDVVLSRRGYVHLDAIGTSLDSLGGIPDTHTLGLNRNFPTFFANPFRSPDAGDLVPLVELQHYGVDTTFRRVHPRLLGNLVDDNSNGVIDEELEATAWGIYNVDDDGNGLIDDSRDAGFGQDQISRRGNGAIPEEEFDDDDRNAIPLFSEATKEPSLDAFRNPYMMYQPMTRLGNLVTNRSNVYAIWVTVGYFEVEPAPAFVDVQEKFGGDGTVGSAATVAARAMYDRVYPEGYALGQEVGIDIGNTKRQRAFYIIDRTEPVGFKPGEDLNVENMIRVRRRIE